MTAAAEAPHESWLFVAAVLERGDELEPLSGDDYRELARTLERRAPLALELLRSCEHGAIPCNDEVIAGVRELQEAWPEATPAFEAEFSRVYRQADEGDVPLQRAYDEPGSTPPGWTPRMALMRHYWRDLRLRKTRAPRRQTRVTRPRPRGQRVARRARSPGRPGREPEPPAEAPTPARERGGLLAPLDLTADEVELVLAFRRAREEYGPALTLADAIDAIAWPAEDRIDAEVAQLELELRRLEPADARRHARREAT